MLERVPIVLVHGWAGSADSWRPVVDRLDTDRWGPVESFRLPGSPGAVSDAATVGSAARELVSLMSALPSPAVVVGHSLGAQVTLRAHGEAPDHVLGEVVIDPAYAERVGRRAEIERWADRIDRVGRSAVTTFFTGATVDLPVSLAASIRADVDATSTDVIASYLRSEYLDDDAIGFEPATRRAAAARVRPVLSLHSNAASAGREARLDDPEGSRSVIWGGRSHYLHLEEPSLFIDLLADWSDRLARAEDMSVGH